MEKRIAPFLRFLPLISFTAVGIATIVFLTSFLWTTWNAITTTETILILKQEVASEALQQGRFNRVIAALKEKKKGRTIDWKKIRNVF